jgi:NTP pyrophosphatase (non-canonical NTP hydrolase)
MMTEPRNSASAVDEVQAPNHTPPRRDAPKTSPTSTGQANNTGSENLGLRALHAANKARQTEWCAGGDPEPDLAFRGNELAGETGEACNVIKKLERERRGWRGSRATAEQLAEELADVVICADLCAVTAGIDLAGAVVAKFNATSEKVGLSTRLAQAPVPPQSTEGSVPEGWLDLVRDAIEIIGTVKTNQDEATAAEGELFGDDEVLGCLIDRFRGALAQAPVPAPPAEPTAQNATSIKAGDLVRRVAGIDEYYPPLGTTAYVQSIDTAGEYLDFGPAHPRLYKGMFEKVSAPPAGTSPLERVRHVKRGTEYEVLGEAEAQVSRNDAGLTLRPIRDVWDGCKLTVYRGQDGKLWCRFTDEFRDGRFVTVESPPAGTTESPWSFDIEAAPRDGAPIIFVDNNGDLSLSYTAPSGTRLRYGHFTHLTHHLVAWCRIPDLPSRPQTKEAGSSDA